MRLNSLKLTTFFVLTASFSVVTSALIVNQNLMDVLGYWGKSLGMTVYLKESATPDSVASLKNQLENDHRFEKVEFISSEKALDQFKDQMKIYASEITNDRDLIKSIPASFQLAMSSQLTPTEQTQSMVQISESLLQDQQIEEVHYGQEWAESYAQTFKFLKSTGSVVLAIILLGSFFVVSNSIRASIESRRHEIEILEFIGATQSYIRRPFLLESIQISVIASASSLLIAYLIYSFVQQSMASHLSMLQVSQVISFLNWKSVVGIVFASAGLGWLAAIVCLRGLNTGWSASENSQGVNI